MRALHKSPQRYFSVSRIFSSCSRAFQDELILHNPHKPALPAASWHDAVMAAAAICLLFSLAVVPLILHDYDRGRGSQDQNTFHLKVIRQFARQWPALDFSDYPSATTPGYHILLAAVDRFVSDSPRVLKLFALFFSIGLLATLAGACTKIQYQGASSHLAHSTEQSPCLTAIVLCLPIACSLYVFVSAAWLLPDNAGWWSVLAALLLALRVKIDRWTYVFSALSLLVVVLVRQNQIWVLAPLCAAVWMKPNDAKSLPDHASPGGLFRVGLLLLASVPSFAALAWFVHLWHGITPPNQRQYVGGLNGAGPVMALAVTGTIGIFYLPMILRRMTLTQVSRVGIPAAIVGFLISVLPKTTYDVDAGRYSGIWGAVLYFPTMGGRSTVLVALAVLGAVIMALWLANLPSRPRWIWLAAALAFGVSQAASHNAFQRYDEPIILIAAALSLAPIARHSPRWTWIGPLALAGTLASIAAFSLRP